MKDETIGNYLKTIYQIQQKKGCVYACNIAEERNISKPSVSRCIHILKKEGYLIADDEKCLILTEKGRKCAEEVIQRYEFFKMLLLHLGIPAQTAERDACRLEYAVCPESFGALKAWFYLKSEIHQLT